MVDIEITSSMEGAPTRINKQRDLMGARTRLVLLQQKINRKFPMYFSMVRRSPC
jgi:hypothetical protein